MGEREWTALSGYALRVVRKKFRDDPDCEDIAQVAAVALWKARDRVDPARSAGEQRQFVTQTALNTALDYLRARQRRRDSEQRVKEGAAPKLRMSVRIPPATLRVLDLLDVEFGIKPSTYVREAIEEKLHREAQRLLDICRSCG